MDKSSRLPGFYDLSVEERAHRIAEWAGLDDAERTILIGAGLGADLAGQMIENVVGTHALPLGIAANFRINSRDYLIPMAIEEPSVVAAASFMAKIVRDAGGFRASSTEPISFMSPGRPALPDGSSSPVSKGSWTTRSHRRAMERQRRTRASRSS